MIEAIVFLPLLGALLAGAIAIVGAHARNPSGDEMDHADHGHGHAAVAHHDHAHDDHAHGHDDHGHPVEPPASGSRAAEVVTTALLLVSCALAWITFVDVGLMHHDARVVLFNWISSGDLKVFWSNGLVSTLMLIGIALLVSPVVFWALGKRRPRAPKGIDQSGTPAA